MRYVRCNPRAPVVVFKVPSLLGVGARARFMHDGRAATLSDRFGSCGGGDAHGVTSQLAAAELADLVSFLERCS